MSLQRTLENRLVGSLCRPVGVVVTYTTPEQLQQDALEYGLDEDRFHPTDECIICAEGWPAKGGIVQILQCGHVYHRVCVHKWMYTAWDRMAAALPTYKPGGTPYKCPMCKTPLTATEIDELSGLRTWPPLADARGENEDAQGTQDTEMVGPYAAAAESPLLAALRAGDVATATPLLNDLDDINYRAGDDGQTLLIWAIEEEVENLIAVVTAILAVAGVNVDARYDRINGVAASDDEDGFTALHAAAQIGNDDVIQRLLDSGAQRAVREGQGRTAEEIAREFGRDEAAGVLRSSGYSFIRLSTLCPDGTPFPTQAWRWQRGSLRAWHRSPCISPAPWPACPTQTSRPACSPPFQSA